MGHGIKLGGREQQGINEVYGIYSTIAFGSAYQRILLIVFLVEIQPHLILYSRLLIELPGTSKYITILIS